MLVEFRVSNFRSIKDEAHLSLVASADTTLDECNVLQSRVKTVPRLTRSAAIYGPNASGKSNLVLAMAIGRDMVVNSATSIKPGQRLPYQPFALASGAAGQPTEFEFTFVIGGVRHQYGFTFDADRICEEWLLVYVAARPQTWFQRRFDAESAQDIYTFSTFLKGDKEVWEKATRPNALFLSTGAQLNSELLLPIYQWFADKLVILGAGGTFLPETTIEALRTPELREQLLNLIATADFGISDISLVERRGIRRRIDLKPDGGIETSSEEGDMTVPQFTHKSSDGSATFELEQESQGTQRFFSFVGPLIDILRNGKLLVVDELDSSLHTLLVRRIVELFHSPAINAGGAQLIFTTHDTSLLDAYGIFRRDQIWFTEKMATHATYLYPLTEFSPRKGEALERGYLSGRYGALPLLSPLDLPVPVVASS